MLIEIITQVLLQVHMIVRALAEYQMAPQKLELYCTFPLRHLARELLRTNVLFEFITQAHSPTSEVLQLRLEK